MLIPKKLFEITQFQQGDDWSFSVYLDDCYTDISIYTLTYVLKQSGTLPISITNTSTSENTFVFSVSHTITALFVPGIYTVTAFIVDNTGLKTTLGYSEAVIKPDLSLSNVSDPRSQYRQALDDVEACLASGAGSDVQEYTVGNTTMRLDRKGLLELRAFYIQRVKMENGLPAIGRIYFNL